LFSKLTISDKIIEYGLFGEPPKILGFDLAGVIEEVGPDVKNYKKGDRMYIPPSLLPTHNYRKTR
jgi:NADPH:quinone reductase-like Zn-dependent oxidoreductase